MATEDQFTQAFRSFARRENLPAELTSQQWADVPREIRERAFFMSRVTDAEILQQFRTGLDDILAGNKGIDQVEKELWFYLRDVGYQPGEGKAGGLEDLSSAARIRTVLDTNIAMARGHAQWVKKQTLIDVWPFQRLVRISARDEKRPWVARWRQAMAELGENTKAVAVGSPNPLADDPLEDVFCVAPLNDPIWQAISIFDQPYPPYDWGSGVGVVAVDIAEGDRLGLKLDAADPALEPVVKSMNEGLEATPQVSDPVLRKSLEESLGRFGEWDGDKMIFTDPDGTRPMTAEKLKEVWDKPAPEGYDTLTQRDELEKWDDGATPDEIEARTTLRKLFDRIVTAKQPDELWRAFSLDPAQAVGLIRGLANRRLNIPANVAGWDWVPRLSQALAIHDGAGEGWTVIVQVRGVKTAKDISAIRPGKPGFVYVGGTEFQVADFKQDVRTRRITITLQEA
ncbi:hypothetical protein OJ996_09085 [Luteolibacter sp. GHJ8]|uniref:Uncharacterized protein n=1 Tax=Luteolibacter rhizosphaerae TaxID=2989719 RepID=A0ABT3G221_9BACT|nr:hypothetical protein [Luteolibacter rhizosphaerae]MCW1913727.1 hypothetical protein [Luteolibacter rhizosphaerae]